MPFPVGTFWRPYLKYIPQVYGSLYKIYSLGVALSSTPWYSIYEIFEDVNDLTEPWVGLRLDRVDACSAYIPLKVVTVRPRDKTVDD